MTIPPSPSTQLQPPTDLSDLRAPVQVRAYSDAVAAAWDGYVSAHPQGSLFHQTGWKRVVEKTFGYEPCYFYAQRAGHIVGILPCFLVSNWVQGRCLISTPLAVYGGICADGVEAEQALLDSIRHFARERGVDFVELRERTGDVRPGFRSNPRNVTFTAALSSDVRNLWAQLPKDTRYMIRKAEKAGLTVRVGADQIDAFYRLFTWNMQRHGTPVYSRQLFDHLLGEFPQQTELLMVYRDSQPVTGVLSFLFRETVIPYYAGAADQARRLAANNFMYWEVMTRAAQAGYRWFDFGRSKKGSGAYAFKMQWNMQVEPLAYQFYLLRRRSTPDFSPVNPKFQLATQVWRRLPMWLTTRIGPRVVAWFP